MASDLSSILNTLTFHTESKPKPFSSFTLYPTLPTELRLKVLFHALPAHRTLLVHPQTLLVDPSFGLYLYFIPELPHLPSSTPTFGNIRPIAPAGWFITARALALLSVSHETRDFYLSNFPCSLPARANAGFTGRGRIHFHPKESIEIHNFNSFIIDQDVIRATTEGWRLQDFWGEIEELVISLDCDLAACVHFVTCLKKLRVVRAPMWEGFSGEVMEDVKRQFRSAMKARLGYIENKLKECKEGNDAEYVVPRFELIE